MDKIKELDELFEATYELASKDGVVLNDGDLLIPHQILFDKNIKGKMLIYLCSYYQHHKSLAMADKDNYNMSKNELRRIKKKLKELGYIETSNLSVEELKEKTIKLSYTGNKCEWCGRESYVLQEHHYPIPARNGGTEVVHICPNCHYTFHTLERY